MTEDALKAIVSTKNFTDTNQNQQNKSESFPNEEKQILLNQI